MVKVKKDLTGKIFGRLTVIKQVEDYICSNSKHRSQWLCQCNCGSLPVVIQGQCLTRKNKPTQSCGCVCKEKIKEKCSKENFIDDSGEYAVGYTLKGDQFWFDKEDISIVKEICWHYNQRGYLIGRDKILKKDVRFHQLVMGYPNEEFVVNHKQHLPRNEHKIDNRKQNLEVVTQQKNMMNRVTSANNTSGRTGVSYNKHKDKYESYITIDNYKIHLGSFAYKDDAIDARKDAELKYFGEYRYDAHNNIEEAI